jgi:hypothetical protein
MLTNNSFLTKLKDICEAYAAYPLFKAVSEKKRKEIAPLIVKLADELLK